MGSLDTCRHSGEWIARYAVSLGRPLNRNERRGFALAIDELESRDHGLTLQEWAAFLELVDPDRHYYRVPGAHQARQVRRVQRKPA
jgi:hypothetical protein